MKSFIVLLSSFLCLSLICCNNKEPFHPPFDNIGGFVIGNESCNADATKDYSILDFTVYPNSPHIGDTLVLSGTTYTNVLKVKGLDEKLKKIGMKVAIDYIIISSSAITTMGCSVIPAVTYNLKEISIINQFEIR